MVRRQHPVAMYRVRYTAYLLDGKLLVGLDADLTGLLHRLLLDECDLWYPTQSTEPHHIDRPFVMVRRRRCASNGASRSDKAGEDNVHISILGSLRNIGKTKVNVDQFHK